MKYTRYNTTSVAQMQKKSESTFSDHRSEQAQPFFAPKDAAHEGSFFTPSVKNDGHNLKAKRFSGDSLLEQAYDNEKFIAQGSSGKSVAKIQMGLMDLGYTLPQFGADGVFGTETGQATRQFQQDNALVPDAIIGTHTMGSLDEKFRQPDVPPLPVCPATYGGSQKAFQHALAGDDMVTPCGDAPPTPLSKEPIIDSITLVKNSTGAVSGFSATPCCKASENKPEAFNDITTGAVANSHQIHFHLKSGNSNELAVKRTVDRKAVRMGLESLKNGNDGPPTDEIRRPTADTLVVADIPGWCVGEPNSPSVCGHPFIDSHFPISYKGDFKLYAYDPVNVQRFGIIYYTVEILKNKRDEASPTNTVTETKQVIK